MSPQRRAGCWSVVVFAWRCGMRGHHHGPAQHTRRRESHGWARWADLLCADPAAVPATGAVWPVVPARRRCAATARRRAGCTAHGWGRS